MNDIMNASGYFQVSDEDHPEYETGRSKTKAQLEDGFLNVADLLADFFCLAKLSESEGQIIWAVIRKTYGWHKKEDRIAASQFQAMTGLHPVKVSAALNSLIARKILYRKGGKFGLIGINTSVKEWKLTKRKGNIENLTKTVKFYENLTKTVKKNLTKTVNHKRQLNTEDVIAKAITLSSDDDEKGATKKVNGTKRAKLPNCPHEEILAAWGKHCSFAPQPSTWGDGRKEKLAARWKAGFQTKHRKTGKPFYDDLQSGIDWWGRFFHHIETRTSLPDADWSFSIDWVIKAANFAKIIDGNYDKRGRS